MSPPRATAEQTAGEAAYPAPALSMPVISRTWLSFAAIGAGVVHLALVISSPLPIAIPLVAFGVAELTWGALILVRDRLVLPRVAQVGALAPLILWSLVTVAATLLNTPSVGSALRFVPMGIAAVFELFIAAVLSIHLRHQSNPDWVARQPRPESAVRYLGAILVAGILVGALTAPALAATQAGTIATEHGGTMGGMMGMDMSGH